MSEEEDPKIVKFNVGGTRYEVARSLIEMHPDTMLARMVSEQWQADPSKEVFIERDESRFKYVLDYLRDGKAIIPMSFPRQALLDNLEYYGVSYCPSTISYSKGDLHAALCLTGEKMGNLNSQIEKTGLRLEMLTFAKQCLVWMIEENQAYPP